MKEQGKSLKKALKEKNEKDKEMKVTTFVVAASKCNNLDDIVKLAVDCKFPRRTDEQVRKQYLSGDSAKSDKYSKSSRTHASRGCEMSKFRRGIVYNEKVNFPVFRFKLEDDEINAIKISLTSRVFGESKKNFNNFLSSFSNKLRTLRDALYFNFQSEIFGAISEFQFQCIFCNVLKGMIAKLPPGGNFAGDNVITANDIKLYATLPTKQKGKSGRVTSSQQTFSGSTDVAISSDKCSPFQAQRLKHIFELKRPFNLLMGKNCGYAQKDQLLIELAGVASCQPRRKIISGALTDGFSLHIAFMLRGTQSFPSKYYVSNRVIDAETYVLYLIMMLVYDDSLILQVLNRCTSSQQEEVEEEKDKESGDDDDHNDDDDDDDDDEDEEGEEEGGEEDDDDEGDDNKKEVHIKRRRQATNRIKTEEVDVQHSCAHSDKVNTLSFERSPHERERRKLSQSVTLNSNVAERTHKPKKANVFGMLQSQKKLWKRDKIASIPFVDPSIEFERQLQLREMRIWRAKFLGIPYLNEQTLREHERQFDLSNVEYKQK